MSAQSYNKLLTESVTKNYKLSPEETYDNINRELKVIAGKLKIFNCIEPMAKTSAKTITSIWRTIPSVA